MSDITPMPNNANNYFRKAMNALQNNDELQGIHLLEESYQLDPQQQIFYELVGLYIKHNLNTKLQQLWSTNNFTLEFIADSPTLSILFAQSLVIIDPNHKSLTELYQLRDLNQDSKSLIHINQAIDNIHDILSTQEKLDHLTTDDDINDYIQFYLQNNQLELLHKLKLMYLINIDKTIHVLKAIVKNNHIYNFIKNDILHFLISSGYSNTINYSWFNKPYDINMSEMVIYKETKYYQEMMQFIGDYFSKQDPHLETQIIELFNLHCMVLFPFYEKAIHTPSKWLNHTLMVYGLINESIYLKQGPLSEEELQYYDLAQTEITHLLT